MSVTAATEKSTAPSSSEKVAPEHETALHRVSHVVGSQHPQGRILSPQGRGLPRVEYCGTGLC